MSNEMKWLIVAVFAWFVGSALLVFGVIRSFPAAIAVWAGMWCWRLAMRAEASGADDRWERLMEDEHE